jgi:hypothetical protein
MPLTGIETVPPEEEIAHGYIGMRKFRWLLHHRIVWAIGGAAAGVGVPVVIGLVLRAFGLINDSSLHSFLLDVGHHGKHIGAAGGGGGGDGGRIVAADAEEAEFGADGGPSNVRKFSKKGGSNYGRTDAMLHGSIALSPAAVSRIST